jgi:sulfite exporter TauE/SafE
MAWNRHSKFLRVLPLLLLGPITGLLGWRMGENLRSKKRVLAALYAVAIVATSAALVSSFSNSISMLAK